MIIITAIGFKFKGRFFLDTLYVCREAARGVKVRVVVLERALDAGWATGCPRCARGARRRNGEAWGGGGGQDACTAIAGRSAAGHEGRVGLRGVGLAVVWLHTGDVTVTEG